MYEGLNTSFSLLSPGVKVGMSSLMISYPAVHLLTLSAIYLQEFVLTNFVKFLPLFLLILQDCSELVF